MFRRNTIPKHRTRPLDWDRDGDWDGVVMMINGQFVRHLDRDGQQTRALGECNCYCVDCRMNAHCGHEPCTVGGVNPFTGQRHPVGVWFCFTCDTEYPTPYAPPADWQCRCMRLGRMGGVANHAV